MPSHPTGVESEAVNVETFPIVDLYGVSEWPASSGANLVQSFTLIQKLAYTLGESLCGC